VLAASAGSLFLLLAACATKPVEPDAGAVAAAYFDAGRVDEAAREVELAVRVNPHDPVLRKQAAAIQLAVGNSAKAVGHLESGVAMTPSDPEMWIALGQIEAERDNTSDAYVAFRRAAELAPDDLRAVSGLALAADNLGFEEEAEAAYARWTQLENAQERE
jgi:Flp pilus assembly protein TadD